MLIFLGFFQTGDIIPKEIINIYGSRIKDCTWMKCTNTDEKHLTRYNHPTNPIPWYYNLVNYIEEIKAQKCASNNDDSNNDASTHLALKSALPKNRYSKSKAGKRQSVKSQAIRQSVKSQASKKVA